MLGWDCHRFSLGSSSSSELRGRDMELARRDQLHLAMGEFLTECSNLENILVSLTMFLQPERTLAKFFQPPEYNFWRPFKRVQQNH
jgi:hypothetical protein